MADVHEFILFGFKPGFDRPTQFETMRDLAPVMTALEGMRRREWYYSERDDLWVTHLIWDGEESIERAGPELERNQRAMELFARLDLDTLVYAKFEAVGSAVGRATL
jgi:hypothetical protein